MSPASTVAEKPVPANAESGTTTTGVLCPISPEPSGIEICWVPLAPTPTENAATETSPSANAEEAPST
ncbi:MAG TPA: hypothetical protein VGX23_12015 [Actinocrinis sp.]|nr:hypothetical protein [Actinocrinis sp.]